VGERHLTEAVETVPGWWGILLAQRSRKGLQLKTVRSPRSNPRKDPRALVELLWLEDALELLEERNAVRGFRGKARWIVWNRVCEVCTLTELANVVRNKLKARAKCRVPV
jgi:hypothetical protein